MKYPYQRWAWCETCNKFFKVDLTAEVEKHFDCDEWMIQVVNDGHGEVKNDGKCFHCRTNENVMLLSPTFNRLLNCFEDTCLRASRIFKVENEREYLLTELRSTYVKNEIALDDEQSVIIFECTHIDRCGTYTRKFLREYIEKTTSQYFILAELESNKYALIINDPIIANFPVVRIGNKPYTNAYFIMNDYLDFINDYKKMIGALTAIGYQISLAVNYEEEIKDEQEK